MMSKKAILLLGTVFVLAVAFAAPVVFAATNDAAASPAPATLDQPTPEVDAQAPAAIAGPDFVEQPAATGFYLEASNDPNSKTYLVPASKYQAAGAYRFWTWAEINPSPGTKGFSWTKFDKFYNDMVDPNIGAYPAVGITIIPYSSRQEACRLVPKPGDPPPLLRKSIDFMPVWVQAGPDGVLGNADDARIKSSVPDTRSCLLPEDNTDWHVPSYNNAYYKQQYEAMVKALADHLLTSPDAAAYRDKIEWVSIGSGMAGENKPVDNNDDPTLQANGLTAEKWVEFVKWTIDVHIKYFYDSSGNPKIKVATQNAPFYLASWERRDIATYAASKNVGLAVNNLHADYVTSENCRHPTTTNACTAFYDQLRLYAGAVPAALEGYGNWMSGENDFYWAMHFAFDLKADYIRLSDFWTAASRNTPNYHTIADWASRYLGAGFKPGQKTPPSIWSSMREHRDPVIGPRFTLHTDDWPTIGNYEFYLVQKHLTLIPGAGSGSVTIPVTDDPRIEKTSWDNNYGFDQERWHKNTSPLDEKLVGAGLYQPTGDNNAQKQVDPGWIARRSDQKTGQALFFFDAADRYFQKLPSPGETTFKAIVTVTYLDTGNDQWVLVYDGVSGPTKAQLWSINDWNIERGLALYDNPQDLVTEGKVPADTNHVQKTNSGKWKVAVFTIADGNFQNGLGLNPSNPLGLGDLYIDSRGLDGSLDGDEYIHRVDVRKTDAFVEATPTPTPTDTPTMTPTPTTTPTPTMTATSTPTVGVISGKTYVDGNGNNQPDAGEGVPGASLTLTGIDNPTSLQTTSDSDGGFSFTNLAPGTYLLAVSPPPGYSEGIPASSVILPVQANKVFSWNFRHEIIATLTATPTPTATPTGAVVLTDRLFLPMLLRAPQ